MVLRDSTTLWGIPVTLLEEHSKKYRLWSAVLYIADLLVIFSVTAYLYYSGMSYEAYGFMVVIVGVFFHFILYQFLNPERWIAFKFYRKYANCKLVERTYDIDTEQLHSVLYCAGCKRLKAGKTFEEYKELFVSSCCEDVKFAKSLMKYMEKYSSESGRLTCVIIIKNKSNYFIDFKEDIDYVSDDGNAGDAEEHSGS